MVGQQKTLWTLHVAAVECAYYELHGIRTISSSCEIPSVQESELNLSLVIRVLSPCQDKMWPELTTGCGRIEAVLTFSLNVA